MDFQLEAKVAIVTGASKGIGRAIAQTLSNEGMQLCLVARSKDLLETLSASLPNPSLVVATDLSHPDAAQTVINATLERFGHLDALVNNAGATKRGDFLELTDIDWSDGFALKFFGTMRLSRAAWQHLKETKGSIVNVSGIGGRTASAEFTIGGSVNAALLNFTKALADRGVTDGVRVNAINPGSILTERLETRVQKLALEKQVSAQEAALHMAENLRIARFGEPLEIARAVAFLVSALASYCQGVILDVDGGQTRTL
jgi:3-oxoacyl-[acyl-carrier protein] reductase